MLKESMVYLADVYSASLNGYSVEVKPRKINVGECVWKGRNIRSDVQYPTEPGSPIGVKKNNEIYTLF